MVPYGGEQLAASFRTVRNNTIRIGEEIPEEQYGFVAAPDVRSVRETLSHIAIATRLWYDMHGSKRLSHLAGYDFFSNNVGLRGDIRYIRGFRGTNDNATGLTLGDFKFWRGSLGLALKF